MHTEESTNAFCAFMAVLYMIWYKGNMALTNSNEFYITVNKAKMSKGVEQNCTVGSQY